MLFSLFPNTILSSKIKFSSTVSQNNNNNNNNMLLLLLSLLFLKKTNNKNNIIIIVVVVVVVQKTNSPRNNLFFFYTLGYLCIYILLIKANMYALSFFFKQINLTRSPNLSLKIKIVKTN